METLMKANVFFFVSSIGFVLLALGGAIALYYLVRLLRTVHRIAKRLETSIDTASEEALLLVDEIRESTIFRLLFGRVRRRRIQKKEEQ